MTTHPRARRRRFVIAAVAAAALLGALAALVTAWGSSSSGDGVAALDEAAPATSTSDEAASTADQEQAMLEFAQCMRDNGVPTFPDPQVNADGTLSFQHAQGIDRAALERTREECRPLLPEGVHAQDGQDDAELQDRQLEFTRCMRDQGVDMPDPDPNGGLHGLSDAGHDAESPKVQAALAECRPILGTRGHGGG